MISTISSLNASGGTEEPLKSALDCFAIRSSSGSKIIVSVETSLKSSYCDGEGARAGRASACLRLPLAVVWTPTKIRTERRCARSGAGVEIWQEVVLLSDFVVVLCVSASWTVNSPCRQRCSARRRRRLMMICRWQRHYFLSGWDDDNRSDTHSVLFPFCQLGADLVCFLFFLFGVSGASSSSADLWRTLRSTTYIQTCNLMILTATHPCSSRTWPCMSRGCAMYFEGTSRRCRRQWRSSTTSSLHS